MSEPARRMTAAEFFDWHEREERRHELVDGERAAGAAQADAAAPW